jgi:hypothetical protein
LSVQVHPPAAIAPQLGGDPKTEMWYFLACDPGSRIYAGLAPGTTRGSFEAALREGTVEKCLHVLPTHAGDSIFIPSGRLHAIGEGNLIVEIQQNSDTTYRVFDWNRAGLDGKPRALHVEQTLVSTDFGDSAPPLKHAGSGELAVCGHFRVEKRRIDRPAHRLDRPKNHPLPPKRRRHSRTRVQRTWPQPANHRELADVRQPGPQPGRLPASGRRHVVRATVEPQNRHLPTAGRLTHLQIEHAPWLECLL